MANGHFIFMGFATLLGTGSEGRIQNEDICLLLWTDLSRKYPGKDYKNLPRLCTWTGKSTRVSKICSPRRGLPSRGYFLLPLSIPITKPHFLLSKTTSKRCLIRKRRQLGLIMTSRHCMIYDVTRCSLKRSCLYRGG